MDFGTLLHVAKRNSESVKNAEGKYYTTKFTAPKKESKDKKLSDNIKRFLAKKEHEEREKARVEKQKRDELLSMRDERSKNKIKKMLKVIKSANKSVLEDAVDNNNTAITLHGPEQPDEDDYGYVSQEASAFYQKYMDKVKTVKEDKQFAPSRPVTKTDLSGTKDRVRAALLREQEEQSNPTRTKSSKQATNEPTKPEKSEKFESSKTSSSPSNENVKTSSRRKDLYDPEAEREMEEKKRREEEEKKRKLKKGPPPVMDFQQLLKLAEQKQHEPVEIVVEVNKEPERLLTKKEKKELEERKAYLESRERRKKEAQQSLQQTTTNKMQPNGKIPKLNSSNSSVASVNSSDPKKVSASNEKALKPSEKTIKPNSQSSNSMSSGRDIFKKPNSISSTLNRSNGSSNNKGVNPVKTKPTIVDNKSSLSLLKPKTPAPASLSSSTGRSVPLAKSSPAQLSSKPSNALNGAKRPDIKPGMGKKEQLMKDNDFRKPQMSNSKSSNDMKSRRPTEIPERARQFPPLDVMRSKKPSKMPVKRRILDDDDSEYDSELDDFIDDGPEEGDNYSSYIKEIFGYDKSRYRDVDEDDAGMESNFAEQMREEYLSKKIGLMEDLEDMRQEAAEKRKKAIKKKKLN